MKKIILAGSILLASAGSFAAANNVGCGLGTVVMGGQSGAAPQILAVTTNGTSGNQTFGISSGTLGCSQDGVVPTNKIAMSFIEGNQSRLAREMATGQGDSVAGLASVLHIADADAATFSSVLKDNYGKIFAQADISGVEVLSNIKQVLANESALKSYASNI
jgi:hypothetical protein